MTWQHPPVAIVGAGLAGLVAANELKRRSVPFRLYEAGKQIAGLAKSFRDEDGFSYDFGAHFITNRLAAALGIGARCRDVRLYGEAVFLSGRSFSYPWGLAGSPRLLSSVVRAKLSKRTRSPAECSRCLHRRVWRDLRSSRCDPSDRTLVGRFCLRAGAERYRKDLGRRGAHRQRVAGSTLYRSRDRSRIL